MRLGTQLPQVQEPQRERADRNHNRKPAQSRKPFTPVGYKTEFDAGIAPDRNNRRYRGADQHNLPQIRNG